jgi:two-component system, NarL family, response regulator LiaR
LNNTLKLVLIEDDSTLRVGLKYLLDKQETLEVVGDAGTGRQGISLVEKLEPDLILMDVGMPGMDGIEACQAIKEKFPQRKVIMLTSHDNERDIFAALAAGANGYCLKDADIDRLLTAIAAVAKGDLWIDSSIAGKLLKALPQSNSSLLSATTANDKVYENLSPRELEVLALVVDGLSNQEISQRLEINLDTVKSHMKHILNKLAVSDRTQAAVKALRQGLV